MGLVIHNSRPDVSPRGIGRESNLDTFSGTFSDERPPPQPGHSGGGSDWMLPASAGWIVAAFAGLLLYALLSRRRLSGD